MGIRLSDYFRFVRPQYAYLKLTPKNSITNHTTHNIARAIASLHKNLLHNIKIEKAKFKKILGKEFVIGTKYSYTSNPKAAYYVYIEKMKVEFYFIVPRHYLSFLKEKISDSWTGLTIKEVNEIPTFSDQALKLQLLYAREDPLSLECNKNNNTLLESSLNVIDVLEESDKVGLFYNFMPMSQYSWLSEYRRTLDKVKRDQPVEKQKFGFWYSIKMLISELNTLSEDIGEVLAGRPKNFKMQEESKIIEQALQSFERKSRVFQGATYDKGRDSILRTQIIILSESTDKLRRFNNAKSLSLSFNSIKSDDNWLVSKVHYGKFDPLAFSISSAAVNKMSANECSNFISLPGRGLLEKYKFIEKIQTQEVSIPKDLTTGTMCIGDNMFKGSQQKAFLSSDFDYQFLSLVTIGPNRAGKSKLLANLAKDAIDNGECVIIPDYIGSCQLSDEIASVFPKDKVLEITCDNYATLQGMGYNEVPPSKDPFVQYKNAKEQTALLMTLVDSINLDNANLTARMGKYFEAAALTVFLTGGTIKDVFSVLMNHKTRAAFINKIPDDQLDNIDEYLDYLSELDDIEKGKDRKVIGTRSHLISGAIDRLQKLKVNAYIETMLKKGTQNNINLVKEFQKNQLIVIKMPQRMFLTDNEKDVYVTYWLTKIWLTLQIREQQIRDRKKMVKVNLIIDELYQVNNAEQFLKEKLSQLPKFNIKTIISCHYLNQLSILRKELRSANASYMLISGCDKENYKELQSELYPFEEEDLLNLPRYHSLNLIKCNEGYGKFITKLPKPLTHN